MDDRLSQGYLTRVCLTGMTLRERNGLGRALTAGEKTGQAHHRMCGWDNLAVLSISWALYRCTPPILILSVPVRSGMGHSLRP